MVYLPCRQRGGHDERGKNMKVLTETRHIGELPDGTRFELDGPRPHEGSDPIVVEDTTVTGAAYRVSWMVPDDDAWSQWEWDNVDDLEWGHGVWRDFRNSHDGGGEIARDAWIVEMVERFGEDNVHLVEVYSHGAESFSRINTRYYPDRQWDVAPACVLVTPPDVTDPIAYADATLAEFTSWANGDVWIVCQNYVTADGTVVHEDICGGFIGHQYATEVVAQGL